MSPQTGNGQLLRVGGHRIDLGSLRLLSRPDSPRLTPRACAVLQELVRAQGLTLSRAELIERVWRDSSPTDDVLTQAIKELRRAFEDDAAAPRYIETVPKVGYRLLAPVEWEAPPESVAPAAPPAPTDAVSRGRGLSPAALWLGGALIAVLALALPILWRNGRDAADATSASRYRIEREAALTTDPGAEMLPAMSADGSRVAYTALDAQTHRMRLALRGIGDSAVLHPSAGLGMESAPVWSPDGLELAFLRYDASGCRVMAVPALGGAELTRGLCSAEALNFFDWSPDGGGFVVASIGADDQGSAHLALRDLSGAAPTPLAYATVPGQPDLAPRYSPDGRWIAFRRGLMPYSDLYVVPAHGGEVRAVTHLGARVRGFTWTPDSRALVFSSDHIGSRDLFVADIESGRVQALDLGPAEFPSGARAAWRMAYEIPRRHAAIVSLDLATGAQAEVAPSTGSDSFPTLAPDGRQIAFVSDRSGRQELWLADESGAARALTHDSPGVLLYPQWRDDSRHLLATRRREGRGELIEIDSVSRQLRVLSPPELDVRFGTPGLGPATAYVVVQAGAASRLLRLGEGAPRALAEGVARVQVDATTRRLLYGRADRPGVIVADPEDLHVLAQIDDVPDSARDAWLVTGGGLWFLAIEGERDIVLRRHDLHSGETRTVWGPPPPGVAIDHLYFSLDASGRRLVSTHTTANDTDIGLFRLIPPGASDSPPPVR